MLTLSFPFGAAILAALKPDSDAVRRAQEFTPLPEIGVIVELLEDGIDSHVKRMERGEPETPVNLVDHIANLLTSPYVTNGLSARAVTGLQRMLLTGEEVQGLQQRIQTLTTCASCNAQLTDREAICFIRAGNTVTFYCTACMHPTAVACRHHQCMNKVGISKRGIRFLTTEECPGHEEGAGVPANTPPEVRHDGVRWNETQALRDGGIFIDGEDV